MSTLKSDPARSALMADILKALGHPVRLRIIATLCDGEASVGDIAAKLAVGQALASQQLRILRMSGLVNFRRENGFAVYGLREPGLVDLVRCLENCRRNGG